MALHRGAEWFLGAPELQGPGNSLLKVGWAFPGEHPAFQPGCRGTEGGVSNEDPNYFELKPRSWALLGGVWGPRDFGLKPRASGPFKARPRNLQPPLPWLLLNSPHFNRLNIRVSDTLLESAIRPTFFWRFLETRVRSGVRTCF